MATSFPDQVLNGELRTQINLIRYSENIKERIGKVLNKAQADIIQTLAAEDSIKPLTAWKENRLLQVNKEIESILSDSYGTVATKANRGLFNVAKVAQQGEVQMLNRALKAEVFDVVLSKEQLRSIATNAMVDGRVIGDWWASQKRSYTEKFSRQLNLAKQAVQVGMIKGDALSEIIRKVRGTSTTPGLIDNAKQDAAALVHTSVMQVANEAKMEMYENHLDLINGFEAVATLDTRTTPYCRALDGKRWFYDENGALTPDGHGVPWPGSPPYHWRCRTTLSPVLKSFSDLVGKKSKVSSRALRAIDRVPGSIRAGMSGPTTQLTYDSWLRNQPARIQMEALGPARFQLWQENKLSMADLIHQDGRPLRLDELRRNLGVGATEDDIASFIESGGFQEVSTSRIRRLIDDCFF